MQNLTGNGGKINFYLLQRNNFNQCIALSLIDLIRDWIKMSVNTYHTNDGFSRKPVARFEQLKKTLNILNVMTLYGIT